MNPKAQVRTIGRLSRRHWLAGVTSCVATAGCAQTQPPDAATLIERASAFIGARAQAEGFQTLWTVAQCEGPQGGFQTEVWSSASGATTFIQRVPGDAPFIAGVNARGAWVRDGERAAPADSATAEIIVTHQFHLMALRIRVLFEVQSATGGEVFQEHNCWRIVLEREGRPAHAFFDRRDYRIRGIRMTRPDGEGDPVEWAYHDWMTLRGSLLPTALRIADNQDIYFYRFTRIAFNALAAEAIGNPETSPEH